MQSAKNILIVGAGGLGVPAAFALARCRVAGITLLDPDPVELSNLARQIIYRESDIGQPKAEAAARRLRDRFSDLKVDGRVMALDPGNADAIVTRHAFVIDATDNPEVKFLINDACLRASRPFVYGGVLGMAGQAMTVVPRETACLRCLFEEPPDASEIASCRDAGIIGPVAGVIGEVQAAEAIASVSGRRPDLAGEILTYDASAGSCRSAVFRTTKVRSREGCRCGAWGGNAAVARAEQ